MAKTALSHFFPPSSQYEIPVKKLQKNLTLRPPSLRHEHPEQTVSANDVQNVMKALNVLCKSEGRLGQSLPAHAVRVSVVTILETNVNRLRLEVRYDCGYSQPIGLYLFTCNAGDYRHEKLTCKVFSDEHALQAFKSTKLHDFNFRTEMPKRILVDRMDGVYFGSSTIYPITNASDDMPVSKEHIKDPFIAEITGLIPNDFLESKHMEQVVNRVLTTFFSSEVPVSRDIRRIENLSGENETPIKIVINGGFQSRMPQRQVNKKLVLALSEHTIRIASVNRELSYKKVSLTDIFYNEIWIAIPNQDLILESEFLKLTKNSDFEPDLIYLFNLLTEIAKYPVENVIRADVEGMNRHLFSEGALKAISAHPLNLEEDKEIQKSTFIVSAKLQLSKNNHQDVVLKQFLYEDCNIPFGRLDHVLFNVKVVLNDKICAVHLVSENEKRYLELAFSPPRLTLAGSVLKTACLYPCMPEIPLIKEIARHLIEYAQSHQDFFGKGEQSDQVLLNHAKTIASHLTDSLIYRVSFSKKRQDDGSGMQNLNRYRSLQIQYVDSEENYQEIDLRFFKHSSRGLLLMHNVGESK